MSHRVIYGPDDGPLSILNLPSGCCPKCYGKNYTESWWQDENGDWSGANMDCLDCGHLWGWTV